MNWILSWFRSPCATPAAVSTIEAPPTESKTLTGWKAWAAGTKRKEIPEEAKAVIAAIEEAKAEVKPEPPVVEQAQPAPPVAEDTTPTLPEKVNTTGAENTVSTVTAETSVASVTGVATTLDTIPEESKELVSEDKKKVSEGEAKKEEEKDLGSDFTPNN